MKGAVKLTKKYCTVGKKVIFHSETNVFYPLQQFLGKGKYLKLEHGFPSLSSIPQKEVTGVYCLKKPQKPGMLVTQ